MSSSENQHYLVYGLVAEEVKACLQAGREPDVEALIREHPELENQIRQLVPTLVLVHQLGEKRDAGQTDREFVPQQLGDFRIVREIGRGGMGVVYEAEQVSLRRRVALKVLTLAATLDPRRRQRFEQEAMAAACLQHQNIVPVYAVGCERGVHYYAMQYIDGQTLAAVIAGLTDESKRRLRGLSQRENKEAASSSAIICGICVSNSSPAEFFRAVTQLGVQAAEALEHAHQMGVVHRDIKPANILIDARGNPWITDFGLAQVQSDTPLTLTGDLIGTLRYSSPEQALGKRGIVDHRTDIYSLGVTLYELLTLQPAFDGRDRQELLQQIANEEPKRPRRINKAIPAELETIVLKAMEKNPGDRYATAQELADDFRNLLTHKPIRARRPSLVHRARKWGRRHPAVMASAVVGLVLAVIALAVSNVLIGRERDEKDAALQQKAAAEARAREEAAIADAVNRFLRIDLLGQAAPDKNARNKDVTVEQLLARAATRLSGKFNGQPLVEAAIRKTIGDTYLQLGDFAAAQPHLARALALRREALGDGHLDTLSTINSLATLYNEQHDFAHAEPLIVEALVIGRRALGEEHAETLTLMNSLADLYYLQDRLDAAEPLLVKVVEARRRILGEDHAQTISSLHNLAMVYEDQDKLDKAKSLLIKVLEASRRVLGDEHPDTLNSMNGLAGVYRRDGEFAKAEPLYEKTLQMRRRVLGTDHPYTLETMNNLAACCWSSGNLNRSIPLLEESWQLTKAKVGEDHANTLNIWANLGVNYCDAGRSQEGIAILEQVLERTKLRPGPFLAEFGWIPSAVALRYDAAGEFARAERLYREVLEGVLKQYGAEHARTGTAMSELAVNQLLQKRYVEAEPLLRESVRIAEKKEANAWTTYRTRFALGEALLGQQKSAEGEPLLQIGYQGMKQLEPKTSARRKRSMHESLLRVIKLYEQTGQNEKAVEWRQKLEAEKKAGERK